MKLVDVIATYVTLRQSMGCRFTTSQYRLQAFVARSVPIVRCRMWIENECWRSWARL